MSSYTETTNNVQKTSFLSKLKKKFRRSRHINYMQSAESSSTECIQMQNAQKFFDYCENGNGWDICKEFCTKYSKYSR